jgi:hypothetical protein
MDNIKPTLTVSQTVKVNELVNLTNTQDLYNKTDHKLNNLNERSVHGVNESRTNLNKTTSQNWSTKVPSKSKPKIKLSHHLNGLSLDYLPSKCKRIERESKRIPKPVICIFPTYSVSLRAS